MLNASDFRKRQREIFEACEKAPVQIQRNSRIYLLMPQEHYVDLVNKVKFPNLVEHPVQTVVHFRTFISNTT